jgi:hypothetical protein
MKTDEEIEHDLLVANTRELLKQKAGKDFIWHILSLTNLYGDNFTGNAQTYYLEGKRSVGLDVLQLLEDVGKTTYARLLLDKQKQEEGK